MANISSYIYCEQANINKGENPEIGKIIDVLTPDYIPGNYSFSIVFSLMDVAKTKDLKVEFLDSDENVIIETDTYQINGDLGEGYPSEYSGVFVAFDFKNITFKNSGIYNTIIYINDEQIGSFPIPVIQKEEK